MLWFSCGKILWCVGNIWLIIVVYTKPKGFINKLLASRIFGAISRLALGIYINVDIMANYRAFSRRDNIAVNHTNQIQNFYLDMTAAIIISYVLYIIIDFPCFWRYVGYGSTEAIHHILEHTISMLATNSEPNWLHFIDTIPKQYTNKQPVQTEGKPDVTELSQYIIGLNPEPMVRNPLHEWALQESNKQLTEAYGRPMIDRIDMTGFPSYCFTTTNRELWYAINYWCIFGFTFDDHLDHINDKVELSKWQMKYMLGTSDEDTPMDRMLVKTLSLLRVHMSADQYVRHVMFGVGWIGSHVTKHKDRPLTHEEYWTLRELDNGGDIIWQLAELSVGFDAIEWGLTDDPLWLAFNKTASKYAIVINDIYSVPSEVAHGGGEYSYQYVLMANEGYTAQQAVDKAVAEVHQLWELVLHYAQRLNEYVNEVLHGCRGNLYWSTQCLRYSRNREGSHYVDGMFN
ncbi:unnamed protein product [Oppiella nova]|uniref:Terpene synthase n=1 Tax=Oppiella nova TaxID=334625 RepID=A0A7R9LNP4_9ACAR|nr:unnamed protein product [Oppiella nova]CAG2165366.1 unnamed protein product [Oppiella nova]